MNRSDRQLVDALSRLALILGERHTTVHCALADLLADGIVGRVSYGTAHLPSSQGYHLTANGIGEAARVLGFDTPSNLVRAYPMSREWPHCSSAGWTPWPPSSDSSLLCLLASRLPFWTSPAR